MISKIFGTVDDINENYFTLMTSGGVGYNIFSTTNTISSLELDQSVTFFIETQVREDSIRLFGFTTLTEKAWFNLLCTVQGIGAKVALSILSSISMDQLYNAISFDDKDLVATANGVGPKMATRIVSELKGKINNLQSIVRAQNTNINLNTNTKNNIEEDKSNTLSTTKIDAVTALVSLGYKKIDAINAVSTVISNKLKNDNSNIKLSLSDLIKASLKTFEIK